MSDYPKALPDEEQQRLLRSLPNEQARKMLIEHNMRLISLSVKRFRKTGYEIEELHSIGKIGLIKAVDTFDYSKGIKFSNYAVRCIENEILMFLRSERKNSNTVSFESVIGYDEKCKELLLKDIIKDKKSSNSMYLCEEIICFLDILNNVVNEVYGESIRNLIVFIYGIGGKSRKETARKFGVARSSISHIFSSQRNLCRYISKYGGYESKDNYLHFYKEGDMICLEMQGYQTIKRPFERESFNDFGDILMERLM